MGRRCIRAVSGCSYSESPVVLKSASDLLFGIVGVSDDDNDCTVAIISARGEKTCSLEGWFFVLLSKGRGSSGRIQFLSFSSW